MNTIDSRITALISRHHILHLATAHDNIPYSCTCFYIYMEDENMFVISSDPVTRHIQEAMQQNNVSCTIALETKVINLIQGLQFTGEIFELKDSDLERAKNIYVKMYPEAKKRLSIMWGIKPNYMKLTDNQLGFGTKIVWQTERL